MVPDNIYVIMPARGYTGKKVKADKYYTLDIKDIFNKATMGKTLYNIERAKWGLRPILGLALLDIPWK